MIHLLFQNLHLSGSQKIRPQVARFMTAGSVFENLKSKCYNIYTRGLHNEACKHRYLFIGPNVDKCAKFQLRQIIGS